MKARDHSPYPRLPSDGTLEPWDCTARLLLQYIGCLSCKTKPNRVSVKSPQGPTASLICAGRRQGS